jgi:hypothetical protein
MTFYLHRNEALDPGLRRIATEQVDIGLRHLADEAEAVCARLLASLGGPDDQSKWTPQPIPIEVQQRSKEQLESGRAAIETWPVILYGFYDIAPGFGRSYRKCLEAWDEIRCQPSDELFHRLRRWSKYHWYHIRILERLNKPELRPRRIVMRRLQKVLGDAHDLVMLEAYLAQQGDPDNQIRQEADARKDELYAEAMQLGHSVFHVPVSRLVADCSGYWADRLESA